MNETENKSGELTDKYPLTITSADPLIRILPIASGVVANIYLAERMASAEREPITGVWGQSPQRGPGAEPLVGVRGRSPPEAESLSVLRRRKETANLPLSCVLGSGLAYCT